MAAPKGFFAFDWSRKLLKYELIAIPEIPRSFREGGVSDKLDKEVERIILDVNFTEKLGLLALIEFN